MRCAVLSGTYYLSKVEKVTSIVTYQRILYVKISKSSSQLLPS